MAEPSPTARALVHTARGVLDVEIWAKEMPQAALRFLERCNSGFYVGSAFHTIAPSYVQAGPDSQEALELETNGRIRFNRRGIVALDSESRLFFTTEAAAVAGTPFGRLANDSIYVLAAIADAEKDGTVPVHPVEITKTEVRQAYFDLPAQPPAPAPEPAPAPRKRQIRVFDDDQPAIVLKKNPRFAPKADAGPSRALAAVIEFEWNLDDFVAHCR